MIRFVIAAMLCTTVLIGGCAQPATSGGGAGGGMLELTVQPQPARAGQEVRLTLTNRSDREVGYNLCPSTLQRRAGNDWQQSSLRFTEVCTMELRVLQPGASDTFRHPLPAGLPAGTYRFRASVEWPLGEGQIMVHSAPFEVAG
jgi:hypothetical protein